MFTNLFTSRLNRKQYICRYIATIIITVIAVIGMGLCYDIPDGISTAALASTLALPLYTIMIVSSIATLSFDLHRINDIGIDSKWILLPIIADAMSYFPGISETPIYYAVYGLQVVIFLYLAAVKGANTEN